MKKNVLCFLLWIMGSALFGATWGDVNGDSEISVIDSLLIAQYVVDLDIGFFDQSVADVSDDGEIDIVDALLIIHYYLEIIDTFPAGPVIAPTPTRPPMTTPTLPPIPTPTLSPTSGPCAIICPCGHAKAEGTIRDKRTLEPIAGALISIKDLSACTSANAVTNAAGEYYISLPLSCTPNLESSILAPGYASVSFGNIYCTLGEPEVKDFYLSLLE